MKRRSASRRSASRKTLAHAPREGAAARTKAAGKPPAFAIRYRCPPGLAAPQRYSQVVEVQGARMIYLSGQVPVDAKFELTTREFRAQVEKVYDNIRVALESVGAGYENIVKTTNYLTDLSQNPVFREVRNQRFAHLKSRPASTTVVVSSLVDPEYLIEIDVIAAVPAA